MQYPMVKIHYSSVLVLVLLYQAKLSKILVELFQAANHSIYTGRPYP